MSKPTQIYIDDSGAVHVSYQCDSCGVWVRTDEYCGYGEDYLCPDCFVPATSPEDKEHAMSIDSHAVNEEEAVIFLRESGFDVQKRKDFENAVNQKFIHDWLVFTNEENLLECGPFAIHKDIVHPNRINDADCSTHEPEEGLPRFGPGILAMSMNSIEDLFFDVNDVHRLFDEGFLNNNAHLIFKRGE